jgi:multicomponent Na+:H+ antiporter subunit E
MNRAAGSARFGLRWAVLVVVWVAIAGVDAAGLVVGAIAAALGAAVSLVLLPPSPIRPSIPGLFALLARFPAQSLAAGADVAVRALSRPIRVAPGFVDHPTRLGPGLSRSAFRALASLQPGSLPVGEVSDDTILMHCLDTGGGVAGQIAQDEARFASAIGKDPT